MAIVTPAADSVPSPKPPFTGPPFTGPTEPKWQQALKRAIRDPLQLCKALQLPTSWHAPAQLAAEQFPLVAPWEYVGRMAVGDPTDPLLRQVLPLQDELEQVPGFSQDPVGDGSATVRPGLLQKYAHRALMVATPTCAVHCRYCFRRHFDYQSTPRTLDDWRPALQELANNQDIHEIILSGGDPLMLPDSRLEQLVTRLAAIPHLQRLRIHTRLPVVIPQRITASLTHLLSSSRMTPIVVIHANHAAELDATVAQAVGQLVDAGVPVLNQSVLLRGVNDSLDTLVELSERLINMRALPYYLHQLDQVAGSAHFFVPLETGLHLVAQMRTQLPGYAVPRYVCEQPGTPHKTPLV